MAEENGLRYVTISGSYRKFPDKLAEDMKVFRDLHVPVLSPKSADILASIDGFVSLRGDVVQRIDYVADSNLVDAMRLVENSHLQAIQQSDALWLVVPDGYCGVAASFEIGWSLAHGVPVFYDRKYFRHVKEPIIMAYAVPTNGIEDLCRNFESMPSVDPAVSRYYMRHTLSTRQRDRITSTLNADVAVGPVIVDCSGKRYKSCQERDILVVKTHKWGGRFSIVGGRIKQKENLDMAFSRVVSEQTGLDGSVSDDICAFNEIQGSGYYQNGASRIFVDKVFNVGTRKIQLDERAEDFEWAPPEILLRDFDLEPNARRTIELYQKNRLSYS